MQLETAGVPDLGWNLVIVWAWGWFAIVLHTGFSPKAEARADSFAFVVVVRAGSGIFVQGLAWYEFLLLSAHPEIIHTYEYLAALFFTVAVLGL